LRGFGIASFALAAGMLTAAAQDQPQEMKSPSISRTQVDWEAAYAELGTADALKPTESAKDRLATLNRATGERFANVAASPVPVLLPFDAMAYLRDRAAGNGSNAAGPPDAPTGNHLAGFQGAPFFQAGPGGYDAVILSRAQELSDLGISFAHPIYVGISGSALLYELDEPAGMIGWPVTGGLEAEFPGIKRLFLENYVRYTFVRYGVPYAISISCFDGGARYRTVSCRDADKVAVRLIKALRLAGGTPAPSTEAPRPDTIARPEAVSTVFTYHSPGSLLPGTGFKGRTGVVDYTVYSKIRGRPVASQLPQFMNDWELANAGASAIGKRRRDARSDRGLSLPGEQPSPSSRMNQRRRTTRIRGATISANTASSSSGSARAASAIRARTSARALASSGYRARTAASPTSTTWWRCATARCCARLVRTHSISSSTRPTSASASAICTCSPSSSMPAAS
jgi:hypothetical protein